VVMFNFSLEGNFDPCRVDGRSKYSARGPNIDYHFLYGSSSEAMSPALLHVRQLEEQARQRAEALHCKTTPSECLMRAFAMEVEAFNFSEYAPPIGPVSYRKS